MTLYQTPAELGEEAMKALRESRESPQEHFARLVRLGWINRQGEVTRLLGGDAEPEPDSEPGQAALAKKKNRRRRSPATNGETGQPMPAKTKKPRRG
jgi:hypothetical protein